MPRTALATAVPELESLGDLPADPAPGKRRPGRPRKTAGATAGNKGRIPARNPNGSIMSKAAMVDNVKAQIFMVAAPLVAVWQFRDPDCSAALDEPMPDGTDRLSAIVDSIVSIIARNDSVLSFMAKSGVMVDLGMLVTALMPVGKTVWKAHGPGGAGHGDGQEARGGDYARDFPAWNPVAPAGAAVLA